jgi:hypothetical protein
MKLPDALREINAGRSYPLSYPQFLQMAQTGTIPARRNPAGTRWDIAPEDLPKIREQLAGAA